MRCSKCGAINGPVGPSLTRRMSNYAKARKRWTDAGKPVRTDEHVEQLRAICRGCDLFNGEVCTHQKCGCPVTRPGIWGDKLRWATEACPIGKWGASPD